MTPPSGMLERPRIVKEGDTEAVEEEEEEEEDEELPSYLREQSSDEEDAALYSKKKLTANGTCSTHCLVCRLVLSHCGMLYTAVCVLIVRLTLGVTMALFGRAYDKRLVEIHHCHLRCHS